jgi:hypothetical protein
MLPFSQALMALPVADLLARVPARPAARAARAAAATAGLALVICTGLSLYFRAWNHQLGPPGPAAGLLDFVRVLKTRPPDEPVLMPRMFVDLEPYLESSTGGREWPPLVVRKIRDDPEGVALQMSCSAEPPFTWLARGTPDQRRALAAVAEGFDTALESEGDVRVLHVSAAREGACAATPPPRGLAVPAADREGGPRPRSLAAARRAAQRVFTARKRARASSRRSAWSTIGGG